MPSPVLFGCVGGFLGAGKTTAIAAAAREIRARGLSVGVVANDQGRDLVDTAVFRGLGLPAAEVTGGCFCCRFDELLAGADRLLAAHPVDVLLAEAVGSCTDLVATVYRPLRRFLPDRFRLVPFTVFVEPDRVSEMCDVDGVVPPDLAYVFDRQLAEADLLVLTKIDLVPPSRRADVRLAVDRLARGAAVLEMSAVRGDGIGAWVDRLLGAAAPVDRAVEIDYDAYARGEAALAWLNATIEVRSADAVGPRAIGERLIAEVGAGARAAGLFLPHVKVLVATSRGSARVALTRVDDPFRWAGDPDLAPEREISVIVNARAATEPEVLCGLVEGAAAAAGRRLGASVEIGRLESFSPARPVPRHRLAASETAPLEGA
jgi:Ni2+-binding GTPase involved in maturation of urease and hydrogenase